MARARGSPQHHQPRDRNNPGNYHHASSAGGRNHHLSSPQSHRPVSYEDGRNDHFSPQSHHLVSSEGGQNHHLSSPQTHHPVSSEGGRDRHLPSPQSHHAVSSEGGQNHHFSSPQSYHPVHAQTNNVVARPHLVALQDGPGHDFHPVQHAELRFPRAPRVHQTEEFPSSEHTDSNYARYLVSNRVEVSQEQRWPDKDDENWTTAQNETTPFGCYSIPESQAMFSAAARAAAPVLASSRAAASAAAAAAAPMLASSMAAAGAAARRLHEGAYLQHQKTFASCLYPKSVKLKLNVGAVEKPAEHMHKMEVTDFVRHRSVRVSLMSSTDSQEAISLKLFHDLDKLEEPEPENIEMPTELMPSPGGEPADEVVKLNLMAFGDTHHGRMHKHCGTGLNLSGEGMRRLGIGAYVGLEMAHQFAVYTLRVLNHGVHIYGPIVAKAAVKSYKELRRGCKIILRKSAPYASHAKGVTEAYMKRSTVGCFKIMRKRRAAVIACLSAEDDSEDELGSEYGEMQYLDTNRPSHYDSDVAWKKGLRVYPDPNEVPEPPQNSKVKNCSCIDDDDEEDEDEPMNFMDDQNPQEPGPGDEPNPEMLSSFEPGHPYSDQNDNPGDGPQGPQQDDGRLPTGNFDQEGRIIPFEGEANRAYYRNPIQTCRRRLSLPISPVPTKPRGGYHHRGIRGHGLGALVWPPDDVRTYVDPHKDDLISKLAVRADYQQNHRDLIQKPINVDEGIWRSTLRAYLKEERAVVRPEDVLLCRRNAPMKLVSREEFERYEEENRHTAHQHRKQRPLLKIAHGDRLVHHCVTKKRSEEKLHPSHKQLPNRGKEKTQFGHNSSFPHVKHHDEFDRSLAKHDDHEKLKITNKGSHGISSVPSGLEDGEFWQTNPVHSSESDWKVLPVSPPPHHGKKRPHSPEDEIMEEVPHSPAFQAVEHGDNSSQAHHPSHHPPGKHQKLEVLSAPDTLMTDKFSNRPLEISKHELSSDRALVGSPAEFGQSGRHLKPSTNYSPQSQQLWQHVGDAQIAESLTVGPKGEHFNGLQNYTHHLRFEPRILCDIPLKPSFGSSLQSSLTPRKYHYEQLHSLPRSIPKGSNEHDKLHTPDLRRKPQDLYPRDKPKFQLWTKNYRRTRSHPSQKCHERLTRIPNYLYSEWRPSHGESRRKCPSLNSEKSAPPWDSSLRSSRSVRSSFIPDLDSKPIAAKSRVSMFKAALSFLRPVYRIVLRKPMKHGNGHLSSKTPLWYPRMLRTKRWKQDHRTHQPSKRPGTPPKTIIKTVRQHSNLSQISGGKTGDQVPQLLVHSQDPKNSGKISPQPHENVPQVKIFLSRKDPCGVRSLLHGTGEGTVSIKWVNRKEKTLKKSFPSATGSKRKKAKQVQTDSKLKNRRRSHESQASSKAGFSFPYPKKAAPKRHHVDVNFTCGLSKDPRKADISPQKLKVSPGKASNRPNIHGGVPRSGRLSRRNHGDPLQPQMRSPSKSQRKMRKYEQPTKAHLQRYILNSGSHPGDSLWSSKFLTPDIAHFMRSLQRAENKPSHTEGQIVTKIHHEPTSKPQTDHEQSIDHNRDGTKSSHPHEHEYQISKTDSEPTSKPKTHRHVAFVDDLEENPTSAASHHVQYEIQSPLVDNPQESDELLDNSDRDEPNETSTQHFETSDSDSGNNLHNSEASHHEPTTSTDLGTSQFLKYILPGDDDSESSSDTSDEVSSPQMSYQRNPDISNLLTAYKVALMKDVQSPNTGTLETESVPESHTILRPKLDAAQQSYHDSSNLHDETLPQAYELQIHTNKHAHVQPSVELSSLESIDGVHPTSGTTHVLKIPTLDALREGGGSLDLNNQDTPYVGQTEEGESNDAPESHQLKLQLEFEHKHGKENEAHFSSHPETHSSPHDENSPAIKTESSSFQLEYQGENSSASVLNVGEPLPLDTDRLLQLVRDQLHSESPDSSSPRSFQVEIVAVRDGEQGGDGRRSVIPKDNDVEGGMIDQNFPKLNFSEKLVAWETISRNYEPRAKQQRASDDMNTGVQIASKHDQDPSESPQVRGLDLAKSSKQQSGTRTIEIISISRSSSRKHLRTEDDDQDEDVEYAAQGLPAENLEESRLESLAAHQSGERTINISLSRSSSHKHLGRGDDDQEEDQEYTTQGLPAENLEESRLESSAPHQSGSRTIDIITISRSSSSKRLGRGDDDRDEEEEYITQGLPAENVEESRLESPAAHLSGERTINIISVSRSSSRKHLGSGDDDQDKDQEYTTPNLPTENLEESRLESPAAHQSGERTINISISRSSSRKQLGSGDNDEQDDDQEYITQGLRTENLEESRHGSPAALQSGERTINISISRSSSRKHLGSGDNDEQDDDQEYITQGLRTENLEESRHGSPAALQSGRSTIISISRSSSRKDLGKEDDDQEYTSPDLPAEDSEEVQQSILDHRSQAGISDNQRDPVKIIELQSPPDRDANEQGSVKKWLSKDDDHLGSRSSQSAYNLKRRRSSDTDVSLILNNLHSFNSKHSSESITKLIEDAVQLSSSHRQGTLDGHGDVKIAEVDFEDPKKPEIKRLKIDNDTENSHQDDSTGYSKKSWLSMDDSQLESRSSLAVRLNSQLVSESFASPDDDKHHSKKRHSKDDSHLGLSSSRSAHRNEVLLSKSEKSLTDREKLEAEGQRNALKLILEIEKDLSESSTAITEDDIEGIISEFDNHYDQHGELKISTLPTPPDTQDPSTNIEELPNTLESGEDVDVQSSDNNERPFQPRPSSSQGSPYESDGTPPSARSKTRGSLFVRPLLKKSLVATSETEAIFSQLRSENNRAGTQDDSRIEKRLSINTRDEGGVRRSSSFQGLQPSDGGRSKSRGSMFVRPMLKKSLVASSETEETFSRLQSEQREQDDGEKIGYRSDSFLDDSGSESRSKSSDVPRSRDSQSLSEGTSVPARSKSRGSSIVRPMLKKSLVADSETQKSIARLQSEQIEVPDSRGRGSVSRSASFEGLRGSRSDSLSVTAGSDRISVPGRSNRGSSFVRPFLKKSLVADLETIASFDRLKSEQNEVEKNTSKEQRLDTREGSSFEGPVGESEESYRIQAPSRSTRGSIFIRPFLKNSLVTDSETEITFARLQSEKNVVEDTSSEQVLDSRERTGSIDRSSSFEGFIESRSSPPIGTDGNSAKSRPRKSLFTRPDLKRSLVANSEIEKILLQAGSEDNELQERLEARQNPNEGLKWVASRASQIISEEALSPPNLASRVSLFDDRFSPESSSRKSLLPRPSLKRSISVQYEPENPRAPPKRVTFDATPEDSSNENYESEARSSTDSENG